MAWHETPLDHFDPSEQRKFNLRYWVDESDWDKENGAPVFLYLCGEWRCSDPNL